VPIPTERSGVYLLLFAGKVVYVGQSIGILSRLNRHQTNMKPKKRMVGPWEISIRFDQILFKPYPKRDLDQVELDLVERFKPEYNRRLKRMHAQEIDLDSLGFNPVEWQPKTCSNGLVRL